MWRNVLKNVEFDNNKILYETLIDVVFLQRNGTYFLNKPSRRAVMLVRIALKVVIQNDGDFVATVPL